MHFTTLEQEFQRFRAALTTAAVSEAEQSELQRVLPALRMTFYAGASMVLRKLDEVANTPDNPGANAQQAAHFDALLDEVKTFLQEQRQQRTCRN